jgi:hypothetical protein
MTAIKNILNTNHVVDVFDKSGTVVIGKKIDKDILKLKKEVAERQLENFDVIKPNKGAGITFNQQINNSSPEKVVDQKKHLKTLLDGCRVDKKEVILIGEKNESNN